MTDPTFGRAMPIHFALVALAGYRSTMFDTAIPTARADRVAAMAEGRAELIRQIGVDLGPSLADWRAAVEADPKLWKQYSHPYAVEGVEAAIQAVLADPDLPALEAEAATHFDTHITIDQIEADLAAKAAARAARLPDPGWIALTGPDPKHGHRVYDPATGASLPRPGRAPLPDQRGAYIEPTPGDLWGLFRDEEDKLVFFHNLDQYPDAEDFIVAVDPLADHRFSLRFASAGKFVALTEYDPSDLPPIDPWGELDDRALDHYTGTPNPFSEISAHHGPRRDAWPDLFPDGWRVSIAR